MFSGLLSAEQGERYRVDASRFTVGLRGADRSAAVAAVHLERGELVGRGTHEELLRLNGRYAALWREQNGKGGEQDA